MLMKSIAAGLAGTALLASVAFAQSPTSTADKSPTAATTTTTTTAAKGDWRASKMTGLKVYNDANENIGSINDLLMEKGGTVKIAVIGVGGFLGMGEHLVAVPYEKLKFVDQAVASTSTTSPPGGGAKSTTTTGAATGTDKTSSSTSSSSSSKWYPDHAVFNATKDELKNMPEFKYSE
jgi:hypothetical protein